jgi:hypothetical protein
MYRGISAADYCSNGLLFVAQIIYEYEQSRGMLLTGETKDLGEKNCPSAILPISNPIRTDRSRTRVSAVRGHRLTA